MDAKDPPSGAGTAGDAAAARPSREDRLAARLRDNLKKRKEQARLQRARQEGDRGSGGE